MDVIKLPKGSTIRLFDAPPRGFKPTEAEERELAVYGIAPRPMWDEKLMKRWQAKYQKRLNFMRPTFRRMDYKRHRLPGREGSKVVHGVETSTIWSGAVVHAPRGKQMKWIESEWTVPNAFPPPGAPSGVWYSASTWIGIDGDGSPDVLQAGCDSDVMNFFFFGTMRQLNPWWEWFPEDTHWISNFPVSQGDTMSCLICVDEGSNTSARIYMMNDTNGAHASFAVTAPSGTTLEGNCAEWIVESLEIDTSVPELASYGAMYFDACNSGTTDNTFLNAANANTMNMLDSSGNVISQGVVENQTLVRCSYEGPLP